MNNQFHFPRLQASRIFGWILFSKQASLAIIDQAVISLSSILLTVVIARTAGMELLGTVGFLLVLSGLGATPLASLISAPAMVLFGSMQENSERYRGFLLLSAVSAGLLLAIALAIVYVIYRHRTGAAVTLAEVCFVIFLFVAMPVQDTLRRAAFARSRAPAGLILSVIRNAPPPIALLLIFFATHEIAIFDVVVVLAIANFVAIVVDLVCDCPQLPGRRFSRHMIYRHWHVSRWLLLSSVFNSAYEQIFTIASGFMFGDRAVAAIRISQQAFGVIIAGMQTFENTVPQRLAAVAGAESEHYGPLVTLLALFVFSGALLSGSLLWWFGNDIILFVLNVNYQEFGNLLACWAGAIAAMGARSIYAMAFRARQDTRPIFIADSSAFVVGAAMLVPVLHWFGVIGSGIGMLVTNLVGLAVLVFLFRLTNGKSTKGQEFNLPSRT